MMRKTENTAARDLALRIVGTLRAGGYDAFLAGGCVRDERLGRVPKDYDVATDALPEDVERLFPKTLSIGKAFGVVVVVEAGETVDVATFRRDIGSLDGRRPESVAFCEAREDALRRDFTINGLFEDPSDNRIIDYVGGLSDLERGVVRAIGNPRRRFAEDHLRMMRAVRFSHVLGFELDPATESAIREGAPNLSRISIERIESEFSRTLLESDRPGDALRHFVELGLLDCFLPEVVAMRGVEQPPKFHPEGDVFEHVVLMLNRMAETPEVSSNHSSSELLYAVLLHDVGKPATGRRSAGRDGEIRMRFNGHAAVGAEMADRILLRLKLPLRERRRIVEVVRGHMRFLEVPNMRESTLRRMMGAEIFPLELALNRLDCLASHGKLDRYEFLLEKQAEWAGRPVLPSPWISGRDLIDAGIPPGPEIGRLLRHAFDAQMEGRFPDREALLQAIREGVVP